MTLTRFADVITLPSTRTADPLAAGIERFVGLEHIEPENLHIRSWGLVADGTTFTNTFKRGQVLFGKRRAYQRKVAVADFDGVCSSDIYVFESKDPNVLLPELLPFILQSEGFYDYAVKTSAGSLSPRTNWTHLANYEFPLPPLDEQRRIADLLWAADDAIVEYEKLLESSKTLLQSKVEAAIQIAKEHNSWATLHDLVKKDKPITYGILKPGTGCPGGIPVIKVRDYPDGKIIEEDLLLTSPEIESEYKRSRLKAGDLLISIRGTVGRLAFVSSSLDGANITQDTARLSLQDSVNHLYVRSMLESNYVRRQIKSKITGLAVQGINIGELRKIEIPILSREEQDKISDQILQIRNTIKEIENHLAASQKLKKQLLNKSLSA
jgi:type I restriction enzyme, S subunit